MYRSFQSWGLLRIGIISGSVHVTKVPTATDTTRPMQLKKIWKDLNSWAVKSVTESCVSAKINVKMGLKTYMKMLYAPLHYNIERSTILLRNET